VVPHTDEERSQTETRDSPEDIDRGITIPVNTIIEADHMVYDLSEAKAILSRAHRIAVEDCGCRTEANNCDSPRDVCLSLDTQADLALNKRGANSHEVTLDEALAILRRSHEAGLVHMAYLMKGEDKPNVLCSCCGCCCNTLGPLLRSGTHQLILSSKYVAKDDHEKCIGCGVCVSRCVFRARKMEGELVYDDSLCMGCGLCATTCPSKAISMIPRDGAPRKA
jgi:ferredoxin